MKNIIIIVFCCLANVGLAEKLIYESASGNIVRSEPDAARVVNGVLESTTVIRPDWSKYAFGVGADLWASTTRTNIIPLYDAGSNLVGAITNTYVSTSRKNNINDIRDFQRLYPLTESERQSAKPLSLRQFENKYLKYCDTLTAATSHTPLSIAQLKAKWQTLTAADKASTLIEFILLNIEGQKESGSNWMADCVWHPEVEK